MYALPTFVIALLVSVPSTIRLDDPPDFMAEIDAADRRPAALRVDGTAQSWSDFLLAPADHSLDDERPPGGDGLRGDPCSGSIFNGGSYDGVNGLASVRGPGRDQRAADDVIFAVQANIDAIVWFAADDDALDWTGLCDVQILKNDGNGKGPGSLVANLTDVGGGNRDETGDELFGRRIYLYTLPGLDIALDAGTYFVHVRPVSDNNARSFWLTAAKVQSEAYVQQNGSDWQRVSDVFGESWGLAFCVLGELAAPDLVARSIGGPPTGRVLQVVEATWTVENIGEAAATGQWLDKVYISTDDKLDGTDSLRGEFVRKGPLEVGQQYEQRKRIQLPDKPGTYYLIVVADGSGSVGENGREENNTLVDDVQVTVQAPNLTVQTVTPPTEALDGEPTTLTWNVRNTGETAALPVWTDRVYLSRDAKLDRGSDYSLGDFERYEELAVDDAYERRGTVTVPAGLNGDWYFIVETDVAGAVPEGGAESDNVLVASKATQIKQPKLPNFQVIDITDNGAKYVGQRFDLAWKVKNVGEGTANGDWRDRVWLSTDDSLSEDDELLIEQNLAAVIAPGVTYTRTGSFLLPGEGGQFWIIAQTNANSGIREANDSDNVRLRPIEVIAPEYHASIRTDIDDAPAGTVVRFLGSAIRVKDGGKAPEVDVDIRVQLRDVRRVFRVRTDAQGDYTFDFKPLAGEAGTYLLAADHPAVSEDRTQDSFVLYGLDASSKRVSRKVVSGSSESVSFDLINFGDAPLTGIVLTPEGVPNDMGLGVSGPKRIDAFQRAGVTIDVSADENAPPREIEIPLESTSAEGAAVTVILAIQIESPRPRLVAEPASLAANMVRGQRSFVEFVIRNVGGAPTGDDRKVDLPEAEWLSLSTSEFLPPLDPGQSTTVVIQLAPTEDQALGKWTGSLTAGGVKLPFEFNCISDRKGDLRVRATDELTYYGEGNPPVSGAKVTVYDEATGKLIASAETADAGEVLFTGLTEAWHRIEVSAEKHGTFKTIRLIQGGREEPVEAFLPYQTVSYEWYVEPVEFEDRYLITIEALFETNVPVPVVTIEPALVDLRGLAPGQSIQVDFVVTNHGLIAAQNTLFAVSSTPTYDIAPLATEFGDLAAKSSITIPTTITRRNNLDEDCTDVTTAFLWELFCGTWRTYSAPVYYHLPDRNCGKPGEPGGGEISGGCNNCGGGGEVNPPENHSQPVLCDPCALKCVVEVGKCLIGFTPLGCPLGVAESCTPEVDTWSEAGGCAWALVGCVPVAGTAEKIMNGIAIAQCIKDIREACDPPRCPGGDRDDDDVFAPIDFDSGDPTLRSYIQRANHVLAFYSVVDLVFDDRTWFRLEATEVDEARFATWIEQFGEFIAAKSVEGVRISDVEREELLALTLPAPLDDAHVDKFINRWNRTASYWSAGIFDLSDLPAGESTDFIPRNILVSRWNAMRQGAIEDEEAGFSHFFEGLEYSSRVIDADRRSTGESGGVCVQVKIRIEQEAVITRDGFRASFKLNNEGEDELKNVAVRVYFLDAEGLPASDLFFLDLPELEGISDLDGGDSLDPGASCAARWLIIPYREAAPDGPREYRVGGELVYTVGEVTVAIPLAPAPITVLPTPLLSLKYFLEKRVYSDDGCTEDEIEPTVPFSLGVMVSNSGLGVAKDMRITSAQPEIIENEKGLLIDFTIIGTIVGNQQFSPSLTVNLGDISAAETVAARWLLTCSLAGRFIAYEATLQHIDGRGDERLSLFENYEDGRIPVYGMIHVVQLDRDGDDNLPDFLTDEDADFSDLADHVHSSADGESYRVTPIEDATTDGVPSLEDREIRVEFDAPAGLVYARFPDPGAATGFRLDRAICSDGRVIRPENAWTTGRWIDACDSDKRREDLVHLFDSDSTGVYTLVYAPPFIRGDMDCSFSVDFDDIEAFVTALVDLARYKSRYPLCDRMQADINQDGDVNFDDIDYFIECITNGGCP